MLTPDELATVPNSVVEHFTRLNALYADFSAAADLTLQRERTMTAGWGRSENARSVSAAKRKIEKQSKSAILISD